MMYTVVYQKQHYTSCSYVKARTGRDYLVVIHLTVLIDQLEVHVLR